MKLIISYLSGSEPSFAVAADRWRFGTKTLIKVLVTTTPVNRLIITPINKVKAKPLTMPEVFRKLKFKGLIKTKLVMMVARLASLIESQARPKPSPGY